jgi:hypothetical protein
MYEVAVMQDEAGVDQKASDAELIALVRRAQEELEAHDELNQLNLLLRDFARELLKQRLLERVEFVLLMEFSRPEWRTNT